MSAKILVVEDERIIAQDLQLRLRKLGFEVCGAVAEGEKAIQQAQSARPDLVLMDLMLEGDMDGVQAAEQINARLGIPIIFITAYADEALFERAKRTNPFGYLLKPFEEKELEIAIQMALKRAQEATDSQKQGALFPRSIREELLAKKRPARASGRKR